MRIMLNDLFLNEQNIRNTENNKPLSFLNTKPHIYIKRGSEKINQLNLIYSLATAKKNSDYLLKLSDILYNCKKVGNYPFKRINLDRAIYKINQNNELYLTLPHFLQNHRSNTIENKSSKRKNFKELQVENWNSTKIFDRNPNLNQSIPNNIPYKNQQIPEKMRKNIYKELKIKYNFESDNEKFMTLPKSPSNRKSLPKIKTQFLSFVNFEKSINKKKENNDGIIDEIKCFNKKTLELNSLKSRNHFRIMNSPVYSLKKNSSVKKYLSMKSDDNIKVKLKSNNGALLKKMQSEINEIRSFMK